MFEAIPIATPPQMRQNTNQPKVGAHPVKTEETANRNAERISSFLRPKRSAQYAGKYGAQQTPQQRATVGPAHKLFGVELKVAFVKRLGAADHHKVVAEQQPAQRGHCRNHPHIRRAEMRPGFCLIRDGAALHAVFLGRNGRLGRGRRLQLSHQVGGQRMISVKLQHLAQQPVRLPGLSESQLGLSFEETLP